MNSRNIMPLPFGAEIDNEGIWCQVLNRCQGPGKRPALFLDRDGVIVEEVHYLHRVEDVNLIEGATDIIARANSLGVPVVVVTNQAGIGYGKYGWKEFADVQERIIDELAAAEAFINAVFACPFHARGKAPYQHPDHPGRKPNPGMLIRAGARLPLDLAHSWIVGDRAGDLEAGKNAGLAGGMHVKTGHGEESAEQLAAKVLGSAKFKVIQANQISDAEEHLHILSST